MRVAFFSTKQWVRDAFDRANADQRFEFTYLEATLDIHTVALADAHDAVCVFVNDAVDAEVIAALSERGVRCIALRCAGFNNVDLNAAHEHGIVVVRVPAYSPHAVAEHALGMMLALNRRYHRAFNRVREGNFSLDGLLGFDVHGKTIGVIGTGRIGQVFCGLLRGFGCRIVAYDKYPDSGLADGGVEYVNLQSLYAAADIISLHCPLTHETYHLINDYAIRSMKRGVMILNTSRGALIDTNSVINGLKSGRIGYLGLDVYEEEGDLFFEDLSDQVIQDDMFVRLQTFPNVLITAHQAFFTMEAVNSIADVTVGNLDAIANDDEPENVVGPDRVHG
ncbi:MAG: 2-hydroxyacid dehydrogenase [Spirochaetaceae bacterium]|nr:MAG: 2-hydroxyacid dehydrogenase [Spirochaetaceae bacterium]